jgi:ABC-type proline/glycine betaine transport system substrate-binding protein
MKYKPGQLVLIKNCSGEDNEFKEGYYIIVSVEYEKNTYTHDFKFKFDRDIWNRDRSWNCNRLTTDKPGRYLTILS